MEANAQYDDIRPGTRIRVRSRFDGTWAGGYEIAGVEPVHESVRYRVRRVAEQTELRETFDPSEVAVTDLSALRSQFWPGLP